jgi:hypothetical protein
MHRIDCPAEFQDLAVHLFDCSSQAAVFSPQVVKIELKAVVLPLETFDLCASRA